MKFRTDINGLRAIAVIAVVLFHFNNNWLPGGFAGVDVFFVISGYLMTGIIFSGLQENKFSVLKFYIARVNRIVPALTVLCLVLIIFGWFYLIPLDYRSLGKHILGSVSFLSNFIYWLEAGYFDSASNEKWLLHTWSLSVEWQFYIIYPLVLVLLNRFLRQEVVKLIIPLSCLALFALNLWVTYTYPNASYYLLFSRAWEMLIGGVAFLYPIALANKTKYVVQKVGLSLIVLSYILISKDNLWPGYYALIPVFGTYLVIISAHEKSILTDNSIFQKLGAWSYSIYLWHWPIVVCIYYFSLDKSFIFIGIPLSILLGYLSYKYIESYKFQRTNNNIVALITSKPIAISVLTGILGISIFFKNGFIEHYDQSVIIANNELENRNPYRCILDQKFPCYIGNQDNIRAIVVGDSHANALATSVSSIFNLDTEGIVVLAKSNCPFILNMISYKSTNCDLENEKRMAYLSDNHVNIPVVWVSRMGVYLFGQSNPKRVKNSSDTEPSIVFRENNPELPLIAQVENNLRLTLKQTSENRTVFIVHPTPEMRRNVPIELAKLLHQGIKNPDLAIDVDLYYDRNATIRRIISDISMAENIIALDPIPYLCRDGKCISQLNSRPIYYDGDHLSEFGNKLLAPMFSLALKKN